MKITLMMITFFITNQVFAELSSSVAVTSDYVWRGQTQSSTAPAVQGSTEYSYKMLTVGTWLSSLGGGNGGAEVDLYASVNHSFLDHYKASLSFTNYAYTRDSNLNFSEYGLTLSSPIVELFVAYTSEYAGAKTSSFYYSLNRSFVLDQEKMLGVSLSIGMTTFDKEVVAGSKDYIDYKVGFTKEVASMSYELFFSGTNRKSWNGSVEGHVKDSTVGVLLTHSL